MKERDVDPIEFSQKQARLAITLHMTIRLLEEKVGKWCRHQFEQWALYVAKSYHKEHLGLLRAVFSAKSSDTHTTPYKPEGDGLAMVSIAVGELLLNGHTTIAATLVEEFLPDDLAGDLRLDLRLLITKYKEG